MSITVAEFNEKVSRLLQAVRQEQPRINATLALYARNLAEDRVVNLGIDSRGGSYGKYSTKPLPAFWFAGKGTGKGADARITAEIKKQRKAGIKNPGISYEQWRQMNNLQVDHKSFKFTGEMWKDIAVLDTTQQGAICTTEVASKGSITKPGGLKTDTLTDYIGDKYGNFLEVNQEEEMAITEAFEEEVQNLIDTYLR